MDAFAKFLGHDIPDTKTCLQAFNPGMKPAAVYINTDDGYARWVERYNHTAQLYVAINPIREGARKFPKDEDVAHWCNEYIDLDGEKPAKELKGYNATDGELERLKPVVERIKTWLAEHGFKPGYCDMTGNGYRWILPVPPLKLDGIDLAKLAAKKKAFKDRIVLDCGIVPGCGAALDSVFDFKRVTGIPGSENVKMSADDRPCRIREPFRGAVRDEDQNLRDYIMLIEIEPAASAQPPQRAVSHSPVKLPTGDKKLQQLLKGNTCDYGSRSEAELALACILARHGLSETEIVEHLVDVPGSKASEKRAAGNEKWNINTARKAMEWVASREPVVNVPAEIEGQYEILIIEQFRILAARYPDMKAEAISNDDPMIYKIVGEDFISLCIELEVIRPHKGDDGAVVVVSSPEVLQRFVGSVEIEKFADEMIYCIEIRDTKIRFDTKELLEPPIWREKAIQCNLVIAFDIRANALRDTWYRMIASVMNSGEVVVQEKLSDDDMTADLIMNRLQRLPIVLENEDFINSKTVLERDDMYIVSTATIERVAGQMLQRKSLTEVRKLLNSHIVKSSAQKTFSGNRFSVWFFRKWGVTDAV